MPREGVCLAKENKCKLWVVAMKYLSICSGYGGAELAFDPLGWRCIAVSEIDPVASSVLAYRFPNVPNLGDFTSIGAEHVGSIDLLVGGTPCQSFSVAGLRGGLGDDRGNLALEFLRLAQRTRPKWILFENVPGIYSATSHISPDPCPPEDDLDSPDGPRDGQEVVVEDEYSSNEDHAFSCFLAGLSELGYGYAYRTLDAQHFGVPQRRRRVFVVGCLGSWQCAAAVLFERHSMSGYPAPRREKGQRLAGCLKGGTGERGYPDPSDGNGGGLVDVAGTLGGGSGTRGYNNSLDVSGAFMPYTSSSHGGYDEGVGTLRSNGGDLGGGSETIISHALTCHQAKGGDPTSDNYVVTGGFPDSANTLGTGGRGSDVEATYLPVAFEPHHDEHDGRGANFKATDTAVVKADTSKAGDSSPHVATGMQVRRLMPVECERLQGVPDGHTSLGEGGKIIADGPRYKMIGNGFAIPVVKYIGMRIQMVEDMLSQDKF